MTLWTRTSDFLARERARQGSVPGPARGAAGTNSKHSAHGLARGLVETSSKHSVLGLARGLLSTPGLAREAARRKRSSDETDLAEPDPPAVVAGGGLDQHGLVPGSGARFARDLRDSSAVVKDQVYRPVRATFSAWGGKRSLR